jgi:hypothetical protein
VREENPNNSTLFDPEALGHWFAKRWPIWQMDLLNAKQLARYCNERGAQIPQSSGRYIENLWQLGLLRADYIESRTGLECEGLVQVGTNAAGSHLYADTRTTPTRPEGWVGCAVGIERLDPRIQLRFHPLRFYVVQYVLHPVGRFPAARPNISPIGSFMTADVDSYKNFIGQLLEYFDEYSRSLAFQSYVDHLHDVARLAIATEPCVFARIFGTQRLLILYPNEFGISVEEFRKLSEDERIDKGWAVHERLLDEQRIELADYYRQIGLPRLREVHQGLCINAEVLNRSKDVLTLLRLARGRRPLEIRDQVGAGLLVRIMAEVVRRFTEEVFETSLPEEDEQGFGFTPTNMKKDRYGSNRVLDGERSVANAFVRGFGLDYGVRVRWYVEGHTEWGALGAVFGRFGGTGVELHNLRARVVSKGRTGFESNLQTDLEGKVFSFVMVDGDRKDYVDAIRKAAEEDRICGRFFIQEPDFEFANFTKEELEQILWEYAEEHGALPEEMKQLHEAVRHTSSGREFVEKAKRVLTERFRDFRRNQDWGDRLMTFAWDNPERPDGEMRPVIEAVWAAQRGLQANFDYEQANFRVDPETGDTVER